MQINGELAKLSLQYGDNLLKETNAFTLVVDNENDLVGLPEGKQFRIHVNLIPMGCYGRTDFHG